MNRIQVQAHHRVTLQGWQVLAEAGVGSVASIFSTMWLVEQGALTPDHLSRCRHRPMPFIL